MIQPSTFGAQIVPDHLNSGPSSATFMISAVVAARRAASALSPVAPERFAELEPDVLRGRPAARRAGERPIPAVHIWAFRDGPVEEAFGLRDEHEGRDRTAASRLTEDGDPLGIAAERGDVARAPIPRPRPCPSGPDYPRRGGRIQRSGLDARRSRTRRAGS